MYSRYELWARLYRSLLSQLGECSSSMSLQNHRSVMRYSRQSDESGWTVCRNPLAEYRKYRERLAKREQLELAREIIAAREIAQHCRNNNRAYSELRKLLAGRNGDDGSSQRELSFVERIFLEHRYIFEAIAKHIRTVDLLTDVKVKPTLDQLPLGKGSLKPETLRQLTEYVLESEYCGYVHIYTDASKSPDGRCGIGVFDETNDVRIAVQLKLDTSIMTAETLAIKVAMQHIAERSIHHGAVLLTDSQAACAFLKKNRNSRTRNAVAHEILEMARTFGVTIQWIPGHVEVSGNRIADELSRAALGSGTARVENDIFLHDAISYIEELRASKINKWYQEYVRLKGKSLKQLRGEEETAHEHYWL